jgi:Xaa-Pro aminopeptidase
VLLNLPRAREIMARERLDGLIAGRAINYYYLTGYWGAFATPVGYDGAYFAALPARESQPAGFVLPALELRRLESQGGSWMSTVFSYTSPSGQSAFADGTPRGADYEGWPVAPGGGPLTHREQKWLEVTRRFRADMSPDARFALARLLRAAGLDRGHIAVDDNRLPGWLAQVGLTRLKCLYAPELFNEIRMIKTREEVETLVTAARINERALLHAADLMAEGETWEQIENRYMMEIAREGGRGVYLLCGLGELPAGRIRSGEPVFFDALGQYRHYHGDFGRCAVVGEPSAEHRRRHRALCIGFETALEQVRPGRRYSEIAAAVGSSVRANGLPSFRDPVVHGLGLEHTDDPKPHCVAPQTKPDQVLQADMIINIDMPHTEIGWGSVHMEDTLHVVPDGCRRLGTADLSLRVGAATGTTN